MGHKTTVEQINKKCYMHSIKNQMYKNTAYSSLFKSHILQYIYIYIYREREREREIFSLLLLINMNELEQEY